MWHAWTQKIQLSGPTVHPLYFDLVGRKESLVDKNLVRPAQNHVNGQMIFTIILH